MTTISTGPFEYRAVSSVITVAATATDVFSITGSATKQVFIQKIGVTCLQTTAGLNAIYLIKRSVANTGGTSTAPTMVPTNSGFVAASASVLQYSANPTVGAAVGNVWGGYLNSPAAATAGVGGDQGMELVFDGKCGPLILNAGEVLSWNLAGNVTPAGLVLLCYVQWYEV